MWLTLALVIVELSVKMTFSRSVFDGGAPSRLVVVCSWVAEVNPMLCTREHTNPKGPPVFLSIVGAWSISILHRCWVDPGVELSIPVLVWPARRCSFTACLGNVSAVSKCILSCLPGAISLVPFLASSVVNVLGSISDVASK